MEKIAQPEVASNTGLEYPLSCCARHVVATVRHHIRFKPATDASSGLRCSISLMQLGHRLHWEVDLFTPTETWSPARNNCYLGKLIAFTGSYS
jgi:hypothetical protein